MKKFGDPDFCSGIFAEISSQCPDLVQMTARLLVKSLKNHGSANTLSSLALAVQGLEILTRNGKEEGREREVGWKSKGDAYSILEYHVLLLLESGIVPYAIEAAYKLKDFATAATATASYFPAGLQLLANLCTTGLSSLYRFPPPFVIFH